MINILAKNKPEELMKIEEVSSTETETEISPKIDDLNEITEESKKDEDTYEEIKEENETPDIGNDKQVVEDPTNRDDKDNKDFNDIKEVQEEIKEDKKVDVVFESMFDKAMNTIPLIKKDTEIESPQGIIFESIS